MVSVIRIQVSRLSDEVRDPAFQELIAKGYRPAFVLPFEPREGAPPELYIVLVKTTQALGLRLLAGLLVASCALQAANLLVTLLR